MRTYMIRRLLLMIPTVFVVTFIVFVLMRLVPGDVVDIMVSQFAIEGGGDVEATREALMRELGMDVSLIHQYGRWLGIVAQADGEFRGVLQGDLGDSLWRPNSVLEEIGRRWPVTVELSIIGLLVGQCFAFPIATYSAIRQDSFGDYVVRSFSILFISIPAFWLATLVIVFPAVWWGFMPPLMYVPLHKDVGRNLAMFIIPGIVLGLSMSGGSMRFHRTMMLEVLRRDYIRTAWSKGLKEKVVIIRHALKNALIPVVTYVGLWMPILVGGTVIIETIFGLPGMGELIVEATRLRDYPVVSGTLIIFGCGMVLINLVVDLTYGFLNPQIHYQ
ncbi:MAG: ABC transporter permease [Spirochaetaceae bacterium]|nr:ABC transporter permease [Spirochaetaceae bacterium]